MSDMIQGLDEKEVIAFKEATAKVCSLEQAVNKTFKEVSAAFHRSLSNYGMRPTSGQDYDWIESGVDCEVLKLGAPDWQKGKLKLRFHLEFVPDQPEVIDASIDEIHQMMNDDFTEHNPY